MAYISLNFLFRQRLFLLIALLFFQFNAIAQNLVPNPSFEEHDSCPTHYSQLNFANSWFPVYNTPDYFNKCANGFVSVPNNLFGFQNCFNFNDSGYVGCATSRYGIFSYREIIGAQLISPLVIGKKYFLSLLITAAFKPDGIENVGCFSNNFGVKFLDKYSPGDTSNIEQRIIDNTAQLVYAAVLNDTSNWTQASTSFIADSAYDFILIGNFFKTDYLIFNCIDTNSFYSYTYIDDICLTPTLNECYQINSDTSTVPIKVENSVSNGEFTLFIDYNYFSSEPISIFNSIGQLIMQLPADRKEVIIKLNEKANGVYIIRLNNFVLKILKI